jgi:hypothetical protein
MRQIPAALAALILSTLAGCHRQDVWDSDHHGAHQGRYSGIGLFAPGELWAKMTNGDVSKDPAAATPDDDDMIVVVVDSVTGEVRECGNYSGRCVSMNPWTRAIAKNQAVPVTLTKHAADLRREHAAAEPVKALDARTTE